MFRECSGYYVKIVVKIIVKVAVKIGVKICCQDLLSRLVVNIINIVNIVNIFNMVNLTNIMISIPAQGLLNLCQIFFKSLSNIFPSPFPVNVSLCSQNLILPQYCQIFVKSLPNHCQIFVKSLSNLNPFPVNVTSCNDFF